VDFKLEFGRLFVGDREMIILADEISPDNCRLWDMKSGHKLDKDRFRQDLGEIEDAYREVARRLGVLPNEGNESSYVIEVNAKIPAKRSTKPKSTTKKTIKPKKKT
jgi:phosphoribosylaminoimidazole-succinocarboxamide synthase